MDKYLSKKDKFFERFEVFVNEFIFDFSFDFKESKLFSNFMFKLVFDFVLCFGFKNLL